MAYRRAGSSGESVVDVAVAEIRQRIRTGDFVPGQRLVAGDLSTQLKISGGPIREALTRLAGEGLIEVQPHRGAVVATQSKEDIVEIFAIREVVEGLAARLAAQAVAGGKSAAEIQQAADMGREKARQVDYLGYGLANLQFHEAIYTLAGSPRITRLSRQLSDQIDRLNNRRLVRASVLQRSAEEHDEILAAILSGNGSLAEERMRRHVSSSGKSVAGSDSD